MSEEIHSDFIPADEAHNLWRERLDETLDARHFLVTSSVFRLVAAIAYVAFASVYVSQRPWLENNGLAEVLFYGPPVLLLGWGFNGLFVRVPQYNKKIREYRSVVGYWEVQRNIYSAQKEIR